MKFGIVISSFHKEMCDQMKEYAEAVAKTNNVEVEVKRVPGTFDMPLQIKKLLKRDDIAGVVLLGVVEKGETDHDKICMQTTASTAVQLSLDYEKPVCNGVVWAPLELVPPRLEDYAVRAMQAVIDLAEEKVLA